MKISVTSSTALFLTLAHDKTLHYLNKKLLKIMFLKLHNSMNARVEENNKISIFPNKTRHRLEGISLSSSISILKDTKLLKAFYFVAI
jgi:hypothetical protein